MPTETPPPPTRRAMRSQPLTGAESTLEEPISTPESAPGGTLVADRIADVPATPVPTAPTALAWVDETRLAPRGPAEPESAPATPDLLIGAPRRSPWRAGILVPVAIIALLLGVYSSTTLLWPLHAVAPRVEAVGVQPAAAPGAAPAWPGAGSAAVSVAGMGAPLTSSGDAVPIASITKVVTALVVLDRQPLAVGEAGQEYRFTAADNTSYWQYRRNGESALDVPVGGTLTQYQLLEGMLIGSANNYADRLAGNLFPSDAVFANAAEAWLETQGIPGITVVEPTGIDGRNAATPDALIPLAQRAMANPVIAEIVGKVSVDLPGAGVVTNTNPLLADPGVVGIKTGSLDAFNLLSAKDVTVDDTTVRLYASVLGQPEPDARDAASRALYAQLELELQQSPVVPAGTVAGRVVTEWGESVDVVTAADARAVVWNGGAASAASDYSLGDAETSGDVVGTFTVAGPVNSAVVDLRLAADVDGPSPWWRLTHPLDLLGLN